MQKIGRKHMPNCRIMRGTVALGTGLAVIALLAVPAGAATLTGKPTTVGKGTAQVIVETDSGGVPNSISVSMTEGAITGVPTELNKNSPEGGYEYALAMPEGVKSGYSEVMIDWKPWPSPRSSYAFAAVSR